ncbi:sulfite oxidase heme-binding subunit YedZ [Glaciecola sp.]|uniref:sulfite oxidase heme-binding subunit YedZ n=1 Tax=Glaciecola sp. MF2-115 TaxID=3384827 RepID=UPI00398A1D75
MSKPIRLPHKVMNSSRYILHAIASSWLIYVFYQGITDNLGGDPVQALLDFTGIGALNLLVMSLIISPLAMQTKFAQLIPLRRPLGLYAAVYAFAHFLVFVAFELQFEMKLVLNEIIERPYITVGFLNLIILIVLSITSITVLKKKMGSSWFTLHSLSYVAVILGGLHYLWLVKSAWYEPAIYLSFSAFLLYLRRQKIKKLFK